MNTIVIIASGNSLTRADVARVEDAGIEIMGINNAYQICDPAYLYACDTDWWKWHYKQVPDHIIKYSLEETKHTDVMQMENDGIEGLSKEWPKLRTGQNGGYQAINLAYLLGYNRIILLGYDMQLTNGKSHWHKDHPGNNPKERQFKDWIENYNGLSLLLKKEDVEVINCTRSTALKCFKLAKLEDVL